jgi:hypothetical protein
MTQDGWKTPAHAWSEALAERVAHAIRSARERGERRSAQDIADETARLGYPLSRSQIANLESGRKRSLDIAELLILSAALNTSPVALMYPNPSDEPSHSVEVLPGVETTEFQAVEWFSGRRHGFTDSTDGAASAKLRVEWQDHTRTLRLWRELADFYERRRNASHIQPGEELSEGQRKQIESYDRDIARLRFELGLDDDA